MTDFRLEDPDWFRKIASNDLFNSTECDGGGARPLNGVSSLSKCRRFPLVRFADVKLEGRPRYLVKGLIPRECLIVVWGPPKCGKSFWVSDLAFHVALGWAYRGRRTLLGEVIYVACEGQEGFRARIEAFRKARLANGNDDPPFHLLPTRLDLVNDVDTLTAEILAQLGATRFKLIVIDTLNRSLVGSEFEGRRHGQLHRSLRPVTRDVRMHGDRGSPLRR